MKVFLDTNIIVDFLGEREPFFAPASKVIEMSKRGMFDMIVSSLSFVNAAYILKKQFDRQILDDKLLHLMSLCKVSKVDGDMILEAIKKQSYDFEDCVQYLSSKTKKADIIITRDEKGFVDLDIPFMTAEEFISKCQE